MLDMWPAVNRRLVPTPVPATQATRWSAHARTLGLAHARALGRCSTFAAADHTQARDPAPRTASPGRAHRVARRCTRVRVRVGGAGHMRVRAPSAKSGFPNEDEEVGASLTLNAISHTRPNVQLTRTPSESRSASLPRRSLHIPHTKPRQPA